MSIIRPYDNSIVRNTYIRPDAIDTFVPKMEREEWTRPDDWPDIKSIAEGGDPFIGIVPLRFGQPNILIFGASLAWRPGYPVVDCDPYHQRGGYRNDYTGYQPGLIVANTFVSNYGYRACEQDPPSPKWFHPIFEANWEREAQRRINNTGGQEDISWGSVTTITIEFTLQDSARDHLCSRGWYPFVLTIAPTDTIHSYVYNLNFRNGIDFLPRGATVMGGRSNEHVNWTVYEGVSEYAYEQLRSSNPNRYQSIGFADVIVNGGSMRRFTLNDCSDLEQVSFWSGEMLPPQNGSFQNPRITWPFGSAKSIRSIEEINVTCPRSHFYGLEGAVNLIYGERENDIFFSTTAEHLFYGMWRLEKLPVIHLGPFADYSSWNPSAYAENLKSASLSTFFECFSLKHVTIAIDSAVSLSGIFQSCKSLESVTIIGDTSNVKNFNAMFYGCEKMKTFPTLNVSNGLWFSNMFGNCFELEEAPSWLENKNLEESVSMFVNCYKLKKLPVISIGLSTADPTKGSLVTSMFANCWSLKNAYIILYGRILEMGSIFSSCVMLENVKFVNTENAGSGWIKNMLGAFTNCHALKSVTMDVTTPYGVYNSFSNCYSLESVNKITFEPNTLQLNSNAFTDCSSLEKVTLINPTYNLSVAYCNLGVDELHKLYDSLGAPTTQKTLEVQGNPGVLSPSHDPTRVPANWIVIR